MTIRQFAKTRNFKVVGNLKLVNVKEDGTKVYVDEARNEYCKSKKRICIIDVDGGVL